jgi:hypothetical protein
MPSTTNTGLTVSGPLGQIEDRLDRLDRELRAMSIWRRRSRWHIERAEERQHLLAERDQLRKRTN